MVKHIICADILLFGRIFTCPLGARKSTTQLAKCPRVLKRIGIYICILYTNLYSFSLFFFFLRCVFNNFEEIYLHYLILSCPIIKEIHGMPRNGCKWLKFPSEFLLVIFTLAFNERFEKTLASAFFQVVKLRSCCF